MAIKTRKVQPCGMLVTHGREYFLLKPQPVERDSWQGNEAYRWVVVPRQPNDDGLFPFARHIVSTSFTVEYSPNMPEIEIRQLESETDEPSIDLADMEWQPNSPESSPLTETFGELPYA